MTSSTIQSIARKLEEDGLTVGVDGNYILIEDPDLDFERSHDGVKGVSAWYREVLDEYEQTRLELSEEPGEPEYQADELPQEENVNATELVEKCLSVLGLRAPEPTEEFAPAPPFKAHGGDQATLAREINARTYTRSAKELAEDLKNDLQDRGGIPSPEAYITEMEAAAETIRADSGVVHTERVEFVVDGVGFVSGPFSRSFERRETAKEFARDCVAAAKNESYAATVKLTPWYHSA